VGQVV